MTLNSFHFVVYFAAFIVVLALLQLVRRKYEVVGKAQLILLLLFSYFFIYKSSWKFCVCVLAYTCFVYVVGLFAKKNKVVLSTGIIALNVTVRMRHFEIKFTSIIAISTTPFRF